ncbi:MAG: hypothetical protein F6J89_19985 [Symploca sp. SIO1C4]|uniref:Uncharacterized protein n=1 Tax=Symploca sp. SIO1C4 TaxID=2607765 RepID=A0A6B3NH17_9CYAN|nr:hypothetical protein [Symploca sp. SIO1C4]
MKIISAIPVSRTVVELRAWKIATTLESLHFRKITIRKLLGIKSRTTFRSHCKHLGFTANSISQPQAEELYRMNRFLLAGRGPYFSRSRFSQLKLTGTLTAKFAELSIDIESELENLRRELKETYEQQKH